ncbi:MAG: hypothetical protein O3B72_04700 [Proteobacteria bacterium]|nr:hypothetical protein [Pseudomonadota bacterium]
MPRFVLIGLCEPLSDENQAAFDEWFIDQHIEDTTRCPIFVRGTVYKLAGPHLDLETKSGYLSLYEVEAPSYEEAEKVLNAWQADSEAWEGRRTHLATMEKHGGSIPMKINGSGWYEELKTFEGPAAKK